ncbi:MAG: hypothetical protein LBK58_15350 [Prevotellaceae bacterium]|nr:hypothetical protein [Prevotellaceae bacterium]
MQKAYNIAGIKKSRQGLNIGRNQFIVQQNPVRDDTRYLRFYMSSLTGFLPIFDCFLPIFNP